MDAWNRTPTAVQRLTRQGNFVFLTDSAIGRRGGRQPAPSGDQPRPGVRASASSRFSRRSTRVNTVCSYAERAHTERLSRPGRARGDKAVGAPRSVEHAWQLRKMLRDHGCGLALGGWANPHAEPGTAGRLPCQRRDFPCRVFLTQVVSHHHVESRGSLRSMRPHGDGWSCLACSACSSTAAPIRERSRF